MEDIIEKYKIKKRNKNLAIIASSFLLAFFAHFSLSNTNIGQSIKSSVLDSTINKESVADLYLKNRTVGGNNLIEVKSGKNISKITSLSFSIAYNTENIDIKNIFGEDYVEILEIGNENGLNSIIVNFLQETDIKSDDILIKIAINKKSAEISQLNIISANFTDSNDNKYSLSTSGIEF